MPGILLFRVALRVWGGDRQHEQKSKSHTFDLRLYSKRVMASPPLRVANARQVARSTWLLMRRQAPSPNATCTPPKCALRALTSAKPAPSSGSQSRHAQFGGRF